MEKEFKPNSLTKPGVFLLLMIPGIGMIKAMRIYDFRIIGGRYENFISVVWLFYQLISSVIVFSIFFI